nr:gag pol polyprotein [Hymenolepis microstoma]
METHHRVNSTRINPFHAIETQIVHQSIEQELSTPFETLEHFESAPIHEPTYIDVPPNVYEQAMTHTSEIRHHRDTGIPKPENPPPNYPHRKFKDVFHYKDFVDGSKMIESSKRTSLLWKDMLNIQRKEYSRVEMLPA